MTAVIIVVHVCIHVHWYWGWCCCDSRLYTNGVNLNPLALYPPVQFPVSPRTPMLSSLVHWDHSSTWDVPTVTEFLALGSGGSASGCASTVEINVSSPDSEDAYLTGHVIDGRVLFPATGYLVLAWRQLARMNGQTYQQTPVRFDDVQIHRATMLPSTGKSGHYNCDTNASLSLFCWTLIIMVSLCDAITYSKVLTLYLCFISISSWHHPTVSVCNNKCPTGHTPSCHPVTAQTWHECWTIWAAVEVWTSAIASSRHPSQWPF